MTHAYSELYLNDAQNLLGKAFDYAINDCKEDPDSLGASFSHSNIGNNFETGNPSIVSGKSGIEVIQDLLNEIDPSRNLAEPTFEEKRTPEYWAGWALAYYQWYSSKKLRDVFNRVHLSEIISMYNTFHEMDVLNFVEEVERRYAKREGDAKLKRIREARNVSQAELAKISGVKLRSIQLYEQKVNDIDKAQAQTLYKLARSLGCQIEDLLENPERN